MPERVVILGISGRMGRLVFSRLKETPGFNCVGGIDRNQPDYEAGVPVLANAADVIELCDLIVDFSLPEATMSVLPVCVKHGKGMVIGTTGYGKSQLEKLQTASKTIPILLSYNMSVGVAMMRKLVRQMAGFFPGQYDVEIIEKHHKDKKDAPSGTAYLLGRDIAERRKIDLSEKAVFGRNGVSLRKKDEVTFHSIRGGSIVGDHEVRFIGDSDQIVISHSAFDRAVFTDGVVLSLEFIKDKKNGWYNLEDVVGVNDGL